MNNCYPILLSLLFCFPLQAMDKQRCFQKQMDNYHQRREQYKKVQQTIIQLRAQQEELITALTLRKQEKLQCKSIKNYISIGFNFSLGFGMWFLIKEIVKARNGKPINYDHVKLAAFWLMIGIESLTDL